MTNGTLDLGQIARQQAMQEAQAQAMIRGFIAETARELYVNGMPSRSAGEEACRTLAHASHVQARYLAEEVFGIRFQDKENQ